MIPSKTILIISLLAVGSVSLSAPRKSSRIINAVGITGGITYSNQKWNFSNPDSKQRNKYLLGFNGSVFAEWLSTDYTSIITELQYNQKGTKESGTSNKNKLIYLCFNNFYRIRYDMDAILPYVLIGPRVEYLLSQGTSSPAITSSFRKIHVTASVGVGVEFVSSGKIKFFTEAHFNPDVMKSYKDSNLSIRAKAFELRIGLKYTFGEDRVNCPRVYK